ncbi:hypothetical protein GGI21_004348, partial [Coemansia aciculifera]
MVLGVLDMFERNMLTFVWEYQGGNILTYMHQQYHKQPGAVAMACTHSSAVLRQQKLKSQTTQTEDSVGDILTRQHIEALDKLASNLMPNLLRALNELPRQ